MAFNAFPISVGNTPTPITAATSDNVAGKSIALKNTGTAPVRLGGEDVTMADGFPLGPGETISFDLTDNEILYAVAASSGTVNALFEGV